MSDPFESDPSADLHGEEPGGEEEVDALPVLAGPPRILSTQASHARTPSVRRPPVAMMPAVQAAAVAAGGFVAGAAVLGLVHRRQRRAGALAQGRRAGRELGRRQARKTGSPAAELLEIVSSRSLLLDVHLLGGAPTDS